MPPLLRFAIRRLIAVPLTLIILTMVLYAIMMISPPDQRARLYFPKNIPSRMTEEDIAELTARIIEDRGLDDPYPLQYVRWLGQIIRGRLGWSSSLRADVLGELLRRTPQTAELTLLSVVILVPLGLVSGIISSIRPDEPLDHSFRLLAFIGTSFPPFVLGLVLLAVFYAGLRLFPPGRLGINSEILISSESFKIFTGMLTVDGILNGRLDITLEALKHLFLPVFTLSLTHWATLGRVMRASMLEEYGKPYIIAARARGIAEHSITWRHTMRNALLPALTSTALTAAALISGVFVIEVIFNLHGISKLATSALGFIPDVPLALGIAIYSVFLVLPIMLALDLLQAIVDPRIREGLSGS